MKPTNYARPAGARSDRTALALTVIAVLLAIAIAFLIHQRHQLSPTTSPVLSSLDDLSRSLDEAARSLIVLKEEGELLSGQVAELMEQFQEGQAVPLEKAEVALTKATPFLLAKWSVVSELVQSVQHELQSKDVADEQIRVTNESVSSSLQLLVASQDAAQKSYEQLAWSLEAVQQAAHQAHESSDRRSRCESDLGSLGGRKAEAHKALQDALVDLATIKTAIEADNSKLQNEIGSIAVMKQKRLECSEVYADRSRKMELARQNVERLASSEAAARSALGETLKLIDFNEQQTRKAEAKIKALQSKLRTIDQISSQTANARSAISKQKSDLALQSVMTLKQQAALLQQSLSDPSVLIEGDDDDEGIAEVEQHMQRNRRAVEDRMKKLQAIEAQLAELTNQPLDEEDSSDLVKARLRYSEELAQVQSTLSALTKEKKALMKEQLASRQKEMDKTQKALEIAQQTLSSGDAWDSEFKRCEANLSEQIHSSEALVSSLEASLSALHASRQEAESHVDTAARQQEHLKPEELRLRHEIDGLNSALNAAIADMAQRSNSFNRAKADVESTQSILKQRLTVYNMERDKLREVQRSHAERALRIDQYIDQLFQLLHTHV